MNRNARRSGRKALAAVTEVAVVVAAVTVVAVADVPAVTEECGMAIEMHCLSSWY